MQITCGSCSASLHIPDEKLPKGVPVVTATCPECKNPIRIQLPQPGDAAAPTPAPAAAPAAGPAPGARPEPTPAASHSVPKAAEEHPLPPPVTEDFSEDHKFAMACFADPGLLAVAKDGLEAAGYCVHLPSNSTDALYWLRRGKYEVVLIHEDFDAGFLSTLQPMVMSMRRHFCIGLVGKTVRTMDNMAAFAKSVNFVVAERGLDKIKDIARQALADNDQFYRIFREAARDAGKV